MATTYAYVTSYGPLVTILQALRKSFPSTISLKTIRNMNLAPKNEGYLINTLKFLGIIDEKGKRIETNTKFFNEQGDDKFQIGLAGMVKKAYKELFDLPGDEPWKKSREDLISFFRNVDSAGAVVGERRARTFQTLAGLAGHGEVHEPKGRYKQGKITGTKKKKGPADKKQTVVSRELSLESKKVKPGIDSDLALTVRIEINLPTGADKKTYDNIFKSIRENLIEN